MTTAIQRKKPKVPEYLIKEVLDGKPVYYQGYKTVLRKEKNLEEIMGISSLQSIILWYLSRIVLSGKNIDDTKYFVFTGEVGVHLGLNSNLSGDIVIYERGEIGIFDKHYFDTPPLIDIEIDVEIDNENFNNFEYLERKTKSLLNFGVQKVIWILTKTNQIIVAEPNKDWLIIDWNKDVEIMNGITFNIPNYLKSEGIPVDL